MPLDYTSFPSSGVYRLTIRLSRAALITVGALGRFRFPAGIYLYCGSAQRNLPSRVARHLRKGADKPLRWHIDYLLASRWARVVDVDTFAVGKAGECDLATQARRDGGAIVALGFGGSDCPDRRTCGTHLVWMGVGKT